MALRAVTFETRPQSRCEKSVKWKKIILMEIEGKSQDPRTLSPLEIDFLLVPHTFHAISNKCFVAISGRNLVGRHPKILNISAIFCIAYTYERTASKWNLRKAVSMP